MNAVQPPGRLAFAFRAFGAMMLTDILSAFLMVVGGALVLFLMQDERWSSGTHLKFFEFVWFWGRFVVTGCAIVLGLFVEWPKAWWLTGRSSAGFGVHLLISLAATEMLLLPWMMASAAVNDGSVPKRHVAESLFFVAVAAAAGATRSATLWWQLVILPMRRARQS